METQVEVVDQFAGSLAVFEPLKAEIEKYKVQNASIVFQYDTAKGEQDARSWCWKLKRLKGPLTEVHKTAKAKALAHCQAVDGEKNWCISEVDDIVKVHMDPINLKTKRAEEAKAAAAEKLRLEKEAEEAARLAELEKREAAVQSEREAIQAEKEKLAGIEEANRKIREGAERARQEKAQAAQNKLDAERAKFEADKRAEADARQREKDAAEQVKLNAEIEAERKERAEKDKKILAERQKEAAKMAEIKRMADKEHRAGVENEVRGYLADFMIASDLDEVMAELVNDNLDRLKIIY